MLYRKWNGLAIHLAFPQDEKSNYFGFTVLDPCGIITFVISHPLDPLHEFVMLFMLNNTKFKRIYQILYKTITI